MSLKDIKRRKALQYLGGVTAGSLVGLSGCIEGDVGGTDSVSWNLTGSIDGSPANIWMQAVAEVVSQNSETIDLSAEVVTSPPEALANLAEGKNDLSWTPIPDLSNLQNERSIFAEDGEIGSVPMVHAVTPAIHFSHTPFATRRNDIETIQDFDGERVALLSPGDPYDWYADGFRLEGIEPENFPLYMGLGDVANAFEANSIAAATIIITGGQFLVAPLHPVFSSFDMKSVQFPSELFERVREERNIEFIEYGEISGDDIVNVDVDFEPVNAGIVSSTIAASPDKDPDLIHEILSILFNNLDELSEYHPILQSFGVGEDRFGFTAIPDAMVYHEGSVRYFDENNIDYPGG